MRILTREPHTRRPSLSLLGERKCANGVTKSYNGAIICLKPHAGDAARRGAAGRLRAGTSTIVTLSRRPYLRERRPTSFPYIYIQGKRKREWYPPRALARGGRDICYLRWKTSVSGGGGASPFSFRVLCLSSHGKRKLAYLVFLPHEERRAGAARRAAGFKDL